MKFPESNSQLLSYGFALIAIAALLLVREVLGTLVADDFLWVLPLSGVYIVSVFGGPGPGLLSIGLSLIGVHCIHLLPTHFHTIPPLERLVLDGLFLLLALAIWGLATARRVAIERASRSAANRERTISQLEELLSMVSHDMRSPLGGVKLSLYLLEKFAGEADPQFKRQLASANRQIARILSLVDRLLEPMRMEGSNEALKLEMFDLAALVTEIVEGMAPQIEEANCSLELNLEPTWGYWDKFRLERVLTNLLSNAAQYARGAAIIIRVRAERDIAWLSVQDHGPGIAAEDIEGIFKRFERARSSEGKRESLGLGLYIARRIVEAHGGTIGAQSDVGRGTTFLVTLPITTAAAPFPIPAQTEPAIEAG
jgi:signal transduction histidine kinase